MLAIKLLYEDNMLIVKRDVAKKTLPDRLGLERWQRIAQLVVVDAGLRIVSRLVGHLDGSC